MALADAQALSSWSCLCPEGTTFERTFMVEPVYEDTFGFVVGFEKAETPSFYRVPCQSAMDWHKIEFGLGCFNEDVSIDDVFSVNEKAQMQEACCSSAS